MPADIITLGKTRRPPAKAMSKAAAARQDERTRRVLNNVWLGVEYLRELDQASIDRLDEIERWMVRVASASADDWDENWPDVQDGSDG
jgi:hypothetical protein